jgi:predicted RNase H-like nuclease
LLNSLTIIGIDCAVAQDKKEIGLALAYYNGREISVQKGCNCNNKEAINKIVEWVSENKQPVLLALDAPLGWPSPLGEELINHLAGRPINTSAGNMFSRLTDQIVREQIGKRPLEVGANLIARTAHSTLTMLQILRNKLGINIRLVWDRDEIKEVCAIEVYPSATLIALRISKDLEQIKLLDYIRLAMPNIQIINQHVLDAVICILGVYDFLRGYCIEPVDIERAKKEGWIWVRNPKIHI